MKIVLVVAAMLAYAGFQFAAADSLTESVKSAASSRDAQLQQVMAEINGH